MLCQEWRIVALYNILSFLTLVNNFLFYYLSQFLSGYPCIQCYSLFSYLPSNMFCIPFYKTFSSLCICKTSAVPFFNRYECDFRFCFPQNFLRFSHTLSIVFSAPFCKITSLSSQDFLMPCFAQSTWPHTNKIQTNTGYYIWYRLSCRSCHHVVNFLCSAGFPIFP